ncbi:helix-turn-helix domain-containing protein [Streptomyces sp. CO7]
MNRTVPARAKLADFLRGRKAAAKLTYEEMAQREAPSKATFERAASGDTVPSWETVAAFIRATAAEEAAGSLGAALTRGQELWIRARRAVRAPGYVHKAPDPDLISSRADLSRALRQQHAWAGCPTPGEMARTSGSWDLPRSTTRRIIAGEILPVDPQQTIAFLKACYVIEPADLAPWLAAAVRALNGSASARYDITKWDKAHSELLSQAEVSREEKSLLRLLPSVAVDRRKTKRELAA